MPEVIGQDAIAINMTFHGRYLGELLKVVCAQYPNCGPSRR